MRSIIILKGLVKEKKRRWVQREKLQSFLLDISDARKLFYRPEFKGEREFLTKSYDDVVYRVFIKALCSHLSTGCLVVVDMDQESTTTIEEIAFSFGYEIFYHVDSTPADYVGKHSKYRDPNYIIPTKDTLKKQVSEFKHQVELIKGRRINTYEDVELYWKSIIHPIVLPNDASILHVSDIHAHWNLFTKKVPGAENFNLTVYLGDYIDGSEVGGSRAFIDLLCNDTRENVIYLEGNHELRLRKYLCFILLKSRGKKIASEVVLNEIPGEFLMSTAIEFNDLSSAEVYGMLWRMNHRLKTHFIYDRDDCRYICTHAGLRWLEQLSPKFIGNVIYSSKNSDRVDECFSRKYYKDGFYSIHGHCAYPSGFCFERYNGVVNIDAEEECNLNYFINKPKNDFELCILKENS